MSGDDAFNLEHSATRRSPSLCGTKTIFTRSKPLNISFINPASHTESKACQPSPEEDQANIAFPARSPKCEHYQDPSPLAQNWSMSE